MEKTISINPGRYKEFIWTLLLRPKSFVKNYLPFNNRRFAFVLLVSVILVVLLYGLSDLILLSEDRPLGLLSTISFSLQVLAILAFVAFVLIIVYYLGLRIFRIKLPFRYFVVSMFFISLAGFILSRIIFVLLLLISKIPDSTLLVNTVFLNDLVIIALGAWQAMYMVEVVKSKSRLKEKTETVVMLSYLMLVLIVLGP